MTESGTEPSRNRLTRRTSELRAEGRTAVAPYLTAGDGGLERTRDLLRVCEEEGAACVELGIPFSDPIADGPVLQEAAQRALHEGTTFTGVCEAVSEFRASGGEIPIVAFTYLNPLVGGAGGEAFDDRLGMLSASGFDGLLVPDLPVEEAGALADRAEDAGLALSLFCAPTTTDERLARAAEASRGFLYVVGRVGVTGRETAIDTGANEYLKRVRRLVPDVPLGLGFGLRTPEQVAAVAPYCELAIVGSAFVRAVHEAGPRAALDTARSFLADLSSPLRP